MCVEGFTPDHKPILGELPGVSGLWLAAAFNSSGIMLGTSRALPLISLSRIHVLVRVQYTTYKYETLTPFEPAALCSGPGCVEQLVKWIVNGRPDLNMFPYDIR